MIIKANTPDGAKSKIFDSHGMEITAPVKQFDTESYTLTIYIPTIGEAKVARTPKKPRSSGRYKDEHGNLIMDKGWECEVITADIVIPGSYAEIDGKKVD